MRTRDAEEIRSYVKTIAFVIGLIIMMVGAVGIFAPSALVWLAHNAATPVELYFIAAFRIAFGFLLFSVASASRTPKALRVVAVIPLAFGIATPFVGANRAPALIDWWSQQGPGLVRLTCALLLAFGGFIAYACAPSRRPASYDGPAVK